MVTQRISSFNVIAGLMCACLVGTAGMAGAGVVATDPAGTLRRTYDMPGWLSTADAQDAVSTLTRALADCRDPLLKARIHYRTGILCFKGGLTDRALEVFRTVADEKSYPAFVRLCSLNMQGQIHRLMGADAQSLDAFGTVIYMGDNLLSGNEPTARDRDILRLICLARIARGEMYGMQGSHHQSAAEYTALGDVLERGDDTDLRKRYGPLAYDRLSQSRLCAGAVAEYFAAAGRLIEEFPWHHRVPVVKLEMLCVGVLTRLHPYSEFHGGAGDAPARTISLIPKMKSSPASDEFLGAMARLCEEHRQGYPGMLLQYHYAWALDAAGKREAAAEAMSRVASTSMEENGDHPAGQAVARIIRDYALIQQATLLSDGAEYRKAMEVLSSVSPTPGTSHIADLQKSVANAIEVLRKEVPRHGTK